MCCWRPSTRGAPTPRRGWTLKTTSLPTCAHAGYEKVQGGGVQLDREAAGPAGWGGDAAGDLARRGAAGDRKRKRDLADCAAKDGCGAAGTAIETAHYVLEIDAKTGAITRLRNKATGREWASATNPIALFTYQTLSQEHYQRFLADYLTTKADWAQKDFGKPNIERFGARDEEWQAKSAEVSCGGHVRGAPGTGAAEDQGRGGVRVRPRGFSSARCFLS